MLKTQLGQPRLLGFGKEYRIRIRSRSLVLSGAGDVIDILLRPKMPLGRNIYL